MNGRDLVERPGAGVLVRRSEVDPDTARIRYRYLVSGPSADATVPIEDVRFAVAKVLDDERYRTAAAEASKCLTRQQRRVDVAELAAAVAAGRSYTEAADR
jgi:hypothetical protein